MSGPSLQPFGRDIWLAAGTEAVVAGFRYPTRMAVIRLADGGLFVWSPVALDDGLAGEVRDLGEVRHVVAPNSLHDLWLGDWRSAYPAARFWAPPGLAAKRQDLNFEGELGIAPPPEWAADLDQVPVGGNAITTEVVFFHNASGTVLFCDLLQQVPKGWHRGWRALVARLDLMVEPRPAVPRKFRIAFTDREAARASLKRILAWPCEKVVMAHGAPVAQGGAAFLAEAFDWLTPTRTDG